MKEEKKGKGVSRRDFIKIAGAGGIAAGALGLHSCFLSVPRRSRKRSRSCSGAILFPLTTPGLTVPSPNNGAKNIIPM